VHRHAAKRLRRLGQITRRSSGPRPSAIDQLSGTAVCDHVPLHITRPALIAALNHRQIWHTARRSAGKASGCAAGTQVLRPSTIPQRLSGRGVRDRPARRAGFPKRNRESPRAFFRKIGFGRFCVKAPAAAAVSSDRKRSQQLGGIPTAPLRQLSWRMSAGEGEAGVRLDESERPSLTQCMVRAHRGEPPAAHLPYSSGAGRFLF
jgi:hypothetical protein